MTGKAVEDENASGQKKTKSYRKSALDAFLPLPLFFDNDEPDNNTKSPTTRKTYQEAYAAYYARKLEYMEKSGKGMQALKKIQTETDMMLFFEKTIQPNFEKLKEFTPILLYRLEKGDQYEIILKGYASPLAKNDYNNYLGQRRVKSLYNFWNTYENNAFEKYFKNGQLKLKLVSFGEETASQSISDDQRNEAASIYSIGAAKERRIEIIEVKGEEK
jgi:outer membrane protein OmpA-like peptidoglycan-associated protein